MMRMAYSIPNTTEWNPCNIFYFTRRTLWLTSLITNRKHGRSYEILCFLGGACYCQLDDDWYRGCIGCCRNHPYSCSRRAHLQDQIQQEQLSNLCVLYKRKTLNLTNFTFKKNTRVYKTFISLKKKPTDGYRKFTLII